MLGATKKCVAGWISTSNRLKASSFVSGQLENLTCRTAQNTTTKMCTAYCDMPYSSGHQRVVVPLHTHWAHELGDVSCSPLMIERIPLPCVSACSCCPGFSVALSLSLHCAGVERCGCAVSASTGPLTASASSTCQPSTPTTASSQCGRPGRSHQQSQRTQTPQWHTAHWTHQQHAAQQQRQNQQPMAA
jgi:hypothetical protein